MNNIRDFRERSKLTQLELAVELGVERTAVTKWETGRSFPRSDKLPALARLLGCTIDDLYSKSPDPTPEPTPPAPLTDEEYDPEWEKKRQYIRERMKDEMDKRLRMGR